jgi:predicted nucleic acid-binding protein
LKTRDTLHLARALHHGCTEFWTNDNRLRAVAGTLAINVLEAPA